MFNKTIRSALSLLLVFCLLLGMSGNAIALAVDIPGTGTVDKIDNEVENVIADLRDAIANLDAQIKEQEATLNKGKAELAQAEAQLAQAEADLAQAEAELLAAGNPEAVAEALAKIEEAKAAIVAANADIAEANKLVGEAEKTLDQANTAIVDATAVVDNVEKTYKDLRAAVADPEVSLTYVKETAKQLQANMEALWESVKTLETSVDSLIAAYAALEASEMEDVQVPEMPAQLTKLDEALDRVIAAAVTLNEAMSYFVAVSKKVLDVAEDVLDYTYDFLKAHLSRDMHIKIYNWLYNNPDQVCELVEKFGVFGLEKLVQYGPYALDLLNNHYDLAVKCMKLTTCGAYLTATLGAKALGYLGDRFDFLKDYREYVAKAVSKLYAAYGDEAKALIKVYVDYLQLQERYYNATHADYTIYNHSKLLVIGDRSASAGYAALLAQMLYKNDDFDVTPFFDSTVDMKTDWSNTTENVVDQLNGWTDLVADADLITVGFGNMNAIREMIDGLLSEKFDKDWSALVGDSVAELIENTLDQLELDMKAHGISQETVDTVLLAAMHYAYAYAQQQIHYPALINKLQTLNKDAQIVIVGSYNELKDITVVVNGNEIAIGKYVQPLIDAANLQSLAEGFLNENVIYVHAPEVNNAGGEMTFDLSNQDDLFAFAFTTEDDFLMMPDQASQAYVAQMIFDALNITDKRTTEEPIEPECQHGDFYEVIENVIEADCENAGSYDKVLYCGKCGEEMSRETILVDALGHNFGCWQLHKLPACDEEGELRRYCDRCGCYESIMLPALCLPDFDIDCDYRDEIMDTIRKLYDLLGDKLFDLVQDATHADYTIYHDSLYVAIGDSTALSDSYVDDLAEMLQIPHMMQNLAQPGLTVGGAIDLVGENADLISKADLITLGFSNLDASVDMLNALNGTYTADWSGALGETTAKIIDKALAELKQQLVQEGMDEATVNMILDGANAYAYAYAARAVRYPALVEAVREVNPEALIVLVGAYNDLEGVVVDLNGRQVNIGKYAEYLIYAANLENLLQAIHGENVIYVHAPEVETVFEENDYENLNNLGYLMSILNDEMLPSEAGHQYIAEKIFEALNVKYEIWGDVNGDRRVDCRDARLILRYRAGLITENDLDLTWADVTGDGRVDARDARWILRVRAELEEHFPVCP